MQAIAKFITALAGAAASLIVGLASQHLGLDLSGNETAIAQGLVSVLTAGLVWLVPNQETP